MKNRSSLIFFIAFIKYINILYGCMMIYYNPIIIMDAMEECRQILIKAEKHIMQRDKELQSETLGKRRLSRELLLMSKLG